MIAPEGWFRRLALGYLRDPHECEWRATGDKLVAAAYFPGGTKHRYRCLLCGKLSWDPAKGA